MIYPDDYVDKVICGDCLEVMKGIPDGAVDLVLTDPPYGLEWGGMRFQKQDITMRNLETIRSWDKRPTWGHFYEIKRVAKSWIIWGGNYFADLLGDCKAPLVWDKQTGKNWRADGEIAWTSFRKGTLRIFRHQWCGFFKDSERNENAIHPTQKPVALMTWCLSFFPDAQLILDPFLGSGTTAVACKQLNRRFIGIENNPDYCKIARERLMGTPDSLFKND